MNRSAAAFPNSARATLLAAAVALALGAAPARALTVLDTFGPGDTSPGLNWSLFDSPPNYQDLAVSFSLSSAQTITDILSSIQGIGIFSVSIRADAGGLPAGTTLFSANLTNPVANSALNGLNWALGAGNYWISSAPASGASGTWRGGNQSTSPPWAFRTSSSGSWIPTGPTDAPSERIITAAVPEPATWLTSLGGIAALAGWRARRRAA